MSGYYKLQVHSRDVLISSGITKHTGYDLIEYDENDNPVRIQSIDLYENNGKVSFDIKDQEVNLSILAQTNQIHGTYVNYEGNPNHIASPTWLQENSYATYMLEGVSNPLAIFNKIKLESNVLNLFSSSIGYDLSGRNCNSSTQYFNQKYLGGLPIFANLPGVYVGTGYDFTKDIATKPGGITDFINNPSISKAINFAENFISCGIEDFDFSGLTTTLVGSGSSQYILIGDGVNSYRTYVSASGSSNTINGTANNDGIIGGAGNDYIYGQNGNDRLYGGAGSDRLYGGNGDDILVGSSGRNYLYGGADNDKLYAGDEGDRLNGDDGEDELYGGDKIDYLYGGTGNDKLYGKGGNDQFQGGDGDDELEGGADNDILTGGDGADTYVWKFGDGLDTVYNDGYCSLDKIKFGDGIKQEDVKFRREGNNLKMFVKDDISQGVVLRDFFDIYGDSDHARTIEISNTSLLFFANGFTLHQTGGVDNISGSKYSDTIYTYGGVDTVSAGAGNDTLIGGVGNDKLYGEIGDDTYVWNNGDGLDTITDTQGANVISFGDGIGFNNLKFSMTPYNEIMINVNGDSAQGVVIYNGNTPFGSDIAKLQFADKTSFRLGNANVIFDNLSDGILYGQSGHNGDDVIFTDVNRTINSGIGNDVIVTGAGNNIVAGGVGNDTIRGGSGNNVYHYSIGDGFDEITENGGSDKIKFGAGIAQGDLTFTKDVDDENNLVIGFKDGVEQGMKIMGFFASDLRKIQTIEFNDGSMFDLGNINLDPIPEPIDLSIPPAMPEGTYNVLEKASGILSGTSGNDKLTITGTSGIIQAGDGDDIINGGSTAYGGEGNDYISGTGTLYGENGDDILIGGKTMYGNEGNDKLYGGVGNDFLSGGNGDNFLAGGLGNDNLTADYGSNVFFWKLGDGLDTINSNDFKGFFNDKIKFGAGITESDLSFSISGAQLKVTVKGDITQGLIINNFNNANHLVKDFEFADGSTIDITNAKYGLNIDPDRLARDLAGTAGDDVIVSSLGNDSMQGNMGNDTYVYMMGDGFDSIIDYGGNDTLKFGEGIGADDFNITQVGDNMRMTFKNDSTQGINLAKYTSWNGYDVGVDAIEFADGRRIDISACANANQLIQAMAAFGVQSSVSSLSRIEEMSIVDNVITASYQK